MASGSHIYVTFGGDTAALEASLALIKAQTQATTRELATAPRAMNALGASADSEAGQKVYALAQQLTALQKSAASVRGELAAATPALGSLGGAAEKGFGGIEVTSRQAAHAVHGMLESITGETERAGRTFSGLAIHLAAENVGFSAAVAGALALGGSLGYIVYKANAANQAMRALQNAAAANGFTIPDQQAKALIASIATLGGMSQSEAAEVAKAFAPLGPAREIVARLAAVDIPALAGSEKKMSEAAAEVVNRMVDLDGAGRKYVETSRSATQAQKDQHAAYVASGDKANAYLLQLRLLSASIIATQKAHELAIAKIQDHAAALDRSRMSGESLTEAEKHIDSAVDDVNAKFERHAAQADKMGQALLNASFDADKLSKALTTAMQVDKVGDEIKKTNEQILSLKAGLASAPDVGAATEMNKALEIAEAHIKQLQERASDGLLGRDALEKTQAQIAMIAATATGSQVETLRKQLAKLQSGSGGAAPGEQEGFALDIANKLKEINQAETKDYEANVDVQVAAASKNFARIVSLREAAVARERQAWGAGSDEEREAIEKLARAKEQAANRGDEGCQR
jgi:hypothetical protein